jgi:protocatechuate 3,4-dioxygenase beta subunit
MTPGRASSSFCKVALRTLTAVASTIVEGTSSPKEICPVALQLPRAARPEVALHEQLEETDRGLVYDLSTLIDRRQVLKLAGFTTISAGLMSIAACAPGASGSPLSSAAATSSSGSGASAAATGTAAADCAVIPEETAGPFPGDGSNGPNVLTQSGIVREDITASFGTSTTKATGVPLTIQLEIQDAANGCAPLQGAAVYLWHCDQGGNYSLYSQAAANENYLRGVQATDGSGVVTFKSIFPACYSGRWPHIHFEVYRDLEAATDEANKIATSQIALPKDACDLVYATAGYESSVRTMSGVSLESDNVFRDDGGIHELGTVTGDVSSGMAVSLAVPVKAT